MARHFQGQNAPDQDQEISDDEGNDTDHEGSQEEAEEENWPSFNGQGSDMPQTSGDVRLWRPARPGYEELGRPESHLVRLQGQQPEERAHASVILWVWQM